MNIFFKKKKIKLAKTCAVHKIGVQYWLESEKREFSKLLMSNWGHKKASHVVVGATIKLIERPRKKPPLFDDLFDSIIANNLFLNVVVFLSTNSCFYYPPTEKYFKYFSFWKRGNLLIFPPNFFFLHTYKRAW